jgi:hypothetical protein
MRSSNRSANGRRFLHLLLIAALVLVSRAPFLLHGDRFFDSDEAVEGLMARHVLQGEHPAFLWGQRYKGVPEVYAAAAVFAVTGSNVVALKSVTLAWFTLFVCLQFVLVERLFSRAIAWIASVFLIAGPPSLVLWSLSGNAEVVMTLLAGTVMCLGIDVWRRTGSRAGFVIACAAAGFGLWVQQYILYYWIAIGLAVLYALPQRRKIVRRLVEGREMPAWLRIATAWLAAAAVVYVGVGAAAFLTGGFDLAAAGVRIGVHQPQKLWRLAAGLAMLTVLVRTCVLAARHSSEARPLATWGVIAFAVGYAPAIAGRLAGGGSGPVPRADLAGVAAAIPPVVRQVAPIVLGFRSPSTGWLGVPLWLGLALVLAFGASFAALKDRPFTPLFHFLVLTTPVLFLVSGAYVDAQSYRYLMPMAGALAVVLALGVWRLFQGSRVLGAVVLAAIALLFLLEQRAWYRELRPDAQSAALVGCLDRSGVRVASADYWLSYKLTFLTAERIVVAPLNGVDRYPRYSAQVRAAPGAPMIPDRMATSCLPHDSSAH